MLKKTLFTIVLILVSAPMVFAAMTATLPGASDSFKYNLSSNVVCLYETDGTYVSYGMACKHLTGTRVFTVSNASSKVYYMENTSTDESTGYIGTPMNEGQPLTDVNGITPGAEDTLFVSESFKPL